MIVLFLHTLFTFTLGLNYGPCRDVSTVEINKEEWLTAGGMYVNIQPMEEGARCQWAFYYLTHDDSEQLFLSRYLKRMEFMENKGIEWSGKRIGRGHYVSTAQSTEGINYTLHTYFLYFDPPNLICYFICTDDLYFRNVNDGMFCDGPNPDPLPQNAPVIQRIAEENDFDIKNLMVVDNCKTNKCDDQIPFEHGARSTCNNLSISEYLNL